MPPTASAKVTTASLPLPNVSYGPFYLLEAVPWLMLASALRFLAFGKPAIVMVVAFVLESLTLFLAFVLAARRMTEINGAHGSNGEFRLTDQLRLACHILRYVGALLFGAMIVVYLGGAHEFAPTMLLGFDGIAFDQFTKPGMVWSSALAAVVFLMVVRADSGRAPSLLDALRVLAARANWFLPAIGAVVAMQFGMTLVQDVGRRMVFLFWETSSSPQNFKNLIYFVFVFGFAALRLWLTLAILTFAFRESHRQTAR